MDFRTAIRKSEQVDQLAAALSRVQGAISHAPQNSKNRGFSSTYANLTSVIDAVRPYLAAENFSFSQGMTAIDNIALTTTLLMHNSGQWIEVDCAIAISTDPKVGTAHAWGSGFTYGRRYGLSAVAGISSEVDDDGNMAAGRI